MHTHMLACLLAGRLQLRAEGACSHVALALLTTSSFQGMRRRLSATGAHLEGGVHGAHVCHQHARWAAEGVQRP